MAFKDSHTRLRSTFTCAGIIAIVCLIMGAIYIQAGDDTLLIGILLIVSGGLLLLGALIGGLCLVRNTTRRPKTVTVIVAPAKTEETTTTTMTEYMHPTNQPPPVGSTHPMSSTEQHASYPMSQSYSHSSQQQQYGAPNLQPHYGPGGYGTNPTYPSSPMVYNGSDNGSRPSQPPFHYNAQGLSPPPPPPPPPPQDGLSPPPRGPLPPSSPPYSEYPRDGPPYEQDSDPNVIPHY